VSASTSYSSAGDVPVLLYHDLGIGEVHDRFRRFVVPPAVFDEHLDALAGAGYVTGSASAVHERTAERQVVLTFDDGFASFGEIAAPIMRSHGMTGAVFVPSAYIGGTSEWLASLGEDHRRILSADDLRDLVGQGMEVGGHGDRHLALDLLDDSDVEAELRRGRDTLEQVIGVPVRSIAYPYGWHGRRVRRIARRAGYDVGFEVGDNIHRGLLRPESDRILRVRRLVVDRTMSGEDLVNLVARGRRSRAAQRARCMARPGWRLVRKHSATAQGL